MKALFSLLALTALSACSTYAVPKYSASAETVAQLRRLQPAKVSLGQLTGERAAIRGIKCRGVGPVEPPEGLTFGEYVRGALKTELILADIYDEASPVRIDGTITALDFSSGYTDAKWTLGMTLSSTTGAAITTNTGYKFTGSFEGTDACNQTAQAGMGAVQSAISEATKSPRFRDLVIRK